MREVMKVSVILHAYLWLVDHWQLWPLIVIGCLAFGFRSDNMAAGLFAAILAARRLSAFFFLPMVTLQIFNSCAEQQLCSERWTGFLTPFAQANFDDSLRSLKTNMFDIIQSSSGELVFTLALRKNSAAKAQHFTVDFRAKGELPRCSCMMWSQKGSPCERSGMYVLHGTARNSESCVHQSI